MMRPVSEEEFADFVCLLFQRPKKRAPVMCNIDLWGLSQTTLATILGEIFRFQPEADQLIRAHLKQRMDGRTELLNF
jgi:hypothetical protein